MGHHKEVIFVMLSNFCYLWTVKDSTNGDVDP